MRGYPQFSFIKWGKNTFELVGTGLKVALTERKEERKPQFRSPYTVFMEIETKVVIG